MSTRRINHKKPERQLAALLLLIGMLVPAWAGYRIPPEMENATEAQKRKYIQVQSQIGLHEKVRVGEERYQQRRAARKNLVEEMKARSEERKEMIYPVAELTQIPSTPDTTQRNLILGFSLLTFPAGVLLVRHWRRQQAEQSTLGSLAFELMQMPETPTQTEPSPAQAWRDRVLRVDSVSLWVEITPEAKTIIPEEKIRERLQFILGQNQVHVEAKSGFLLKFSLTGEWDERKLMFLHREELTLLEPEAAVSEPIKTQPRATKLWSTNRSDVSEESKASSSILEATEDLTAQFCETLLAIQQPTAAS